MEKIIYSGNKMRIDHYLRNSFEYSRSFFQHLFIRGGIKVNNRSIKKSYQLKNGDIIEIDHLQRYLSPLILEEAPHIQIPIKLETDDYLVIYKPKGVLSHPNTIWDVKNPSVVGFLYHQFKNLPTINHFIRSGLIHRLDKETDGLMLVAKTEPGLEYFKNLFYRKSQSNTIEEKENIPLKKHYRTTAHITEIGIGNIEKIKNNLPYYINEIVRPKGVYLKEYKSGITKIINYKLIDNSQIYFEIEILTGRTHQIRYHLAMLGLPICGDTLYGIEDNYQEMQLTAYKLEFLDNNNKELSVSI